LVGMAHSALYSATKAAIHPLKKSWAAEYGPFRCAREHGGARADDHPDHGCPRRPDPAHHRPRPSQRPSTPAQIAAAVAFLVSDNAANIHGATLSVDGGLTAI